MKRPSKKITRKFKVERQSIPAPEGMVVTPVLPAIPDEIPLEEGAALRNAGVFEAPVYTAAMANTVIDVLVEKYEAGAILGRFTVKSPPYILVACKPTVDHTEEHDKKKLYCICRKVYDFNRFVDIPSGCADKRISVRVVIYSPRFSFYIGCDYCNEWYHGSCVNITSQQCDLIEKYVCKLCIGGESKTNVDVNQYCTCLMFIPKSLLVFN